MEYGMQISEKVGSNKKQLTRRGCISKLQTRHSLSRV